jgi:hypothetical protein
VTQNNTFSSSARSEMKRSTFYKLPPKPATNVNDDYIQSRNKREELKHQMEMAVLCSQLNINILKAQSLTHDLQGKSTVSNHLVFYATGYTYPS